MRLITVRQPWAWLIVHGGKDVENRVWSTSYRGAVAIHAAQGTTPREYEDCAQWLARAIPGGRVPTYTSLTRGCIIGVAEVVDCVRVDRSPWFFGPNGLVLRRRRPLSEPIPYRGVRRMGGLPVEVAERVMKLAL